MKVALPKSPGALGRHFYSELQAYWVLVHMPQHVSKALQYLYVSRVLPVVAPMHRRAKAVCPADTVCRACCVEL